MAELDDNTLTPDEMRAWLEQEVRDLTKSLELRVQDATDFVTAYCAGRISGREATARLRKYDTRWGDPISGVNAQSDMTNEEIVARLDQFLAKERQERASDSALKRLRGPGGGRLR
jgi:hypothetical protein